MIKHYPQRQKSEAAWFLFVDIVGVLGYGDDREERIAVMLMMLVVLVQLWLAASEVLVALVVTLSDL